MFFVLLLGIVIYVAIHAYRAYSRPSKDSFVCVRCHSIVTPKKRAQGSGGVEFILWLFLIIPGLIYTIWRGSKDIYSCPVCSAENPIPINTPAGRALAEGAKATD